MLKVRKTLAVIALMSISCAVVAPANAAILNIGIGSFSGGETVVPLGSSQGYSDGDTAFGALTITRLNGDPSNVTLNGLDNDQPFDGQAFEILFPSGFNKFGFIARFNSNGSTTAAVEFFQGATSLGTAQTIAAPAGSPGTTPFTGFASTSAFDRVVITGPGNGYLELREPRYEVPAPGAAGLLALAGLGAMRRRR